MVCRQCSCGHRRKRVAGTYWTSFEKSPSPQTVREELEREVRYANITIIEGIGGIGASQYGIGMVSARSLRWYCAMREL
jgi:hypothetical protein